MSSSTMSSLGSSYSPTDFSINNTGGSSSARELSTESITTTTTALTHTHKETELSVAYTTAEALVSFFAICGNALVVHVFCTNRSLRRYRNYYIVALAVADFLVGLLGIPFAVLASVGIPKNNLYGCLFTVSILIVLCTVSILCLVAVSIDRYWATTNPFAYYRNMTTTTAVGIIFCCWFVGAIIGFLPLFGWYNKDGWNKTEHCIFVDVMDYSYLVFLYFATIVFPAFLMAGFYGYIYHVVLIKIRQRGTLAPQGRRPSEQSRSGSLNSDNRMMRMIVSEKRREAKAAKKLGIIVLFFMICWMPLYTINCIQAFCPKCKVPVELINFTIILSHANSSLNPFLYAYHLKEFRIAMKNSLCSFFGYLLCGLVNTQAHKDPFLGGVSRSHTLPSLANASLSTQTGKFSLKFRKGYGADSHKDTSPNNCMMSMESKDNLFANTATEKSQTSLSSREDNSLQALELLDPTFTTNCKRDECNKIDCSSPMVSETSGKISPAVIITNIDTNTTELASPITTSTISDVAPASDSYAIATDNVNANKTGEEEQVTLETYIQLSPIIEITTNPTANKVGTNEIASELKTQTIQ